MDAGLLPCYLGARAYDREGARLGHVADVLFDVATNRPAWLLLVLLRASDRFVFVPARGARQRARGIVLPCDREQVRAAPLSAGPPHELAPGHAAALAEHFGLRGVGQGPWAGLVEPTAAPVDDRVRMVA